MVRKNKLIDVAKSGKRELRETGKLSIKLNEKDELIGVNLAQDSQDIMLSTTDGKCLRFPVKSLRLFTGLNSGGVKGIKLDKNNFSRNILITGRNNNPLFSLRENIDNFLIIEADYQSLCSLKYSGFKFGI